MESAQRDLLGVLLKQLREKGLLSQAVYEGAADLVCSAADLPELLRPPARSAKEADPHEHSQNPQRDEKRKVDL